MQVTCLIAPFYPIWILNGWMTWHLKFEAKSGPIRNYVCSFNQLFKKTKFLNQVLCFTDWRIICGLLVCLPSSKSYSSNVARGPLAATSVAYINIWESRLSKWPNHSVSMCCDSVILAYLLIQAELFFEFFDLCNTTQHQNHQSIDRQPKPKSRTYWMVSCDGQS